MPGFTVGERRIIFARDGRYVSPIVGFDQGALRVVEGQDGPVVVGPTGTALSDGTASLGVRGALRSGTPSADDRAEPADAQPAPLISSSTAYAGRSGLRRRHDHPSVGCVALLVSAGAAHAFELLRVNHDPCNRNDQNLFWRPNTVAVSVAPLSSPYNDLAVEAWQTLERESRSHALPLQCRQRSRPARATAWQRCRSPIFRAERRGRSAMRWRSRAASGTARASWSTPTSRSSPTRSFSMTTRSSVRSRCTSSDTCSASTTPTHAVAPAKAR